MARITDAYPISRVDADDPPLLTEHGDADCVVPLRQSTRLRDIALAVER